MIKAESLKRHKNIVFVLWLHNLKSWEKRTQWRTQDNDQNIERQEKINEKSNILVLSMGSLRQDLKKRVIYSILPCTYL